VEAAAGWDIGGSGRAGCARRSRARLDASGALAGSGGVRGMVRDFHPERRNPERAVVRIGPR